MTFFFLYPRLSKLVYQRMQVHFNSLNGNAPDIDLRRTHHPKPSVWFELHQAEDKNQGNTKDAEARKCRKWGWRDLKSWAWQQTTNEVMVPNGF